MSPATIAIIPLVLAMTGGWVALYKSSLDDGWGSAHSATFATIALTIIAAGLVGLAYLAGVVYFDEWGFPG